MATKTCDILFINARLATMTPGGEPYGVADADALTLTGDRISGIGQAEEFSVNAANIIDLEGRWITPGLIDCHTHLVHAGNRAQEFEMGLNGASYEEIAAAGGGILSTVKATRDASESELAAESQPRLQAMIKAGVTTVEIKSGYGLDLETEMKMLEVAKQLGEINPVRVQKTFLGAHALPEEFAGNSDGYMAKVIHEMLPTIHALGLIDAIDAFWEKIAFSEEQVRHGTRCPFQGAIRRPSGIYR